MTDFDLTKLKRSNVDAASYWLSQCPECHRLERYEQTVRRYAADGCVIRDGYYCRIRIGDADVNNPHWAWTPVEFLWRRVKATKKPLG